MGDQNFIEEKLQKMATGKTTTSSKTALQNAGPGSADNAQPNDEAELRKKVEARTEYLNSIKLRLS